MVLAYRQKTGCKQYVFDSIYECFRYFDKKAYDGERIKCIDFGDDRKIKFKYSYTVRYGLFSSVTGI